MRIRELDLERDLTFLRRCVIELQEIERGCDPRLPAGLAMVDAYCATLLERCREWSGVLLVADALYGPLLSVLPDRCSETTSYCSRTIPLFG